MRLEKVRGDRMFDFVTETWNPITGCLHGCYNGRCWARIFCSRFEKRLGYGFTPTFHRERLERRFKQKTLVFVCSMGDMFGQWVPEEWILEVLRIIQGNLGTGFFLQTKNPGRLREFLKYIPRENTILSTTIETQSDAYTSWNAPGRSERFSHFSMIERYRKHLSIEPVMDFDLDEFTNWIIRLSVEAVSVGYDNYGANLPEPPLEKTLRLIKELEKAGIEVHRKFSLKGRRAILRKL